MKKIILGFMLTLSITLCAQKMKIVKGNLDFLKEQTELKVVFKFKDATFYNDNLSYDEYILKKKKDYIEKNTEADFQKWLADWQHTMDDTIPDKFISSFNKNSEIKASTTSNTKYTLIVDTFWIYPGWYGGVMSQPSKVSTNLKFVDENNPENILAEVESLSAIGDNFIGVPNNNDRIAEGYAKTGKSIAKLIEKKR